MIILGIFNRIKNLVRSNTNGNDNLKDGRNLFNICVGDIVTIEDTDYEVEGVLKFNDHGWKWIEYKLKDVRKTYWLSVEEDDEVEIALYEEVTATISEPPRTLEYKGINYYMQEGSDAKVEEVLGKLNVVKGEDVDYYEYCDEDQVNFLSIEIWNGEIEMSIGRPVKDYNVEIYPGS